MPTIREMEDAYRRKHGRDPRAAFGRVRGGTGRGAFTSIPSSSLPEAPRRTPSLTVRGQPISDEALLGRTKEWERWWGPESAIGKRRAVSRERFQEGRPERRAQRLEEFQLRYGMTPVERAAYTMQKRRRQEVEAKHKRELELERARHPEKVPAWGTTPKTFREKEKIKREFEPAPKVPAPTIRVTATEIIGVDTQTGKILWSIPKGGLSPDEIRDINFAIKILDPINAGTFGTDDERWAKGILKRHRERRGFTGKTQTATSGQTELTSPTEPAETDEGRLQRELNAAYNVGDYAKVRKIQDEARRKGYIQ